MFHIDGGLKLTQAGLALDDRRRQPRGFISHAHADHMGRHEWAYATPATAALYRHRMGGHRQVREMPYGTTLELGGVTLSAHPAGHCLGSAMLLADDGQQRLLYTGDFKLGQSLTATTAAPPKAEILIMESTFGSPRYRLPPREEVIEQLLLAVRQALAAEKTPVIHAYALGKSQEVTAILSQAGIPVLQHRTIAAVSQVYTTCGVNLGNWAPYEGQTLAGHAVITLPRSSRGYRLAALGEVFSIAVTGWAMHPSTKYRLGVNLALPLSDHADFDELLALPRLVEPQQIYCTHGPEDFYGHLCDAGWDAQPLISPAQRRLF